MKQTDPMITLVQQSILAPEEAGRAVIALNPQMPVRWMLLAFAVVASVLIQFIPPILSGGMDGLVAPLWPAFAQFAMNLAIILMMTFVGRMAGGTGTFPDALLLVGWMQCVSLLFMVAVLLAGLLIPSLEVSILIASVVITIWILVGFICALHGFQSKALVLIGSFMVMVVFSLVLSIILLMLGFEPIGVTDV